MSDELIVSRATDPESVAAIVDDQLRAQLEFLSGQNVSFREVNASLRAELERVRSSCPKCEQLEARLKIAGLQSQQARCEQLEVRLEELTNENKLKTADLRRLQAERDPERIAAAIAEACERTRVSADAEIAKLRSDNAQLVAECRELKASKKKLREALERAREVGK